MKDGKKDEYFLLSNSGSKRLRYLLAQNDRSSAYFAFMTVVLFAVLMSPGERISCRDILTNVRLVEPRFPVDVVVTKGAGSAALAVPELGEDFFSLITRMRRVSISGGAAHLVLKSNFELLCMSHHHAILGILILVREEGRCTLISPM